MKIVVSREKFLKSLQKVSSIIGSRSMLPVLGNVLLQAENGVLELTTTDLEIRITTRMEAKIEEEGKTTVPAKKITALVSRFSDSEVTLAVDENNHIKLDCGTGHFTLLGLPAADFPGAAEFEVLKEIRLKEADFKDMFGAISYAVSPDDSRKVLTGVLFNTASGLLSMVATDGKRLALQEKTVESITGEDGSCIIPLKAASEVRRSSDGSGDLTIGIGEKQCRFTCGDFSLTSKLIEGNYPDYRQVIPKAAEKMFSVPAAPMLAKLETVAQVLSDSSSYVILEFADNKLTIKASSTEVGEGSDVVPIQYEGEPVEVSFNPAYLADPLRIATAENVTIKVNDALNPVVIEGKEGFLCVIMPIRKK